MELMCKKHKIEMIIHCNEIDKFFCSQCIKESKDCREKSHKHIPYKEYLEILAEKNNKHMVQIELLSEAFQEKSLDLNVELNKFKENKPNNLLLFKIGTLVKQKASKDELFSKNIFRNCKKSFAFERKKLDSPFLFHYKWDSPIIFHLYNLVSNTAHTYNLYNQALSFDIEEMNGEIYFCGGYIGSYLSTCWSLDLSNYRKVQGMRINSLNDARDSTSLISTLVNLYIVGGYNGDYMNSCEMLGMSGNWKKVAKLHSSSSCITLAYVYPSYIYCLGSSQHLTYEKLNLETVNNANWKVLQIQRATRRGSGCTIQMKEGEVLLFGGYGTNEFSVLNLKELSITKMNKPFNCYFYFGSKLRLFCGNIHIISRSSEKRILVSSILKLEYSESEINF